MSSVLTINNMTHFSTELYLTLIYCGPPSVNRVWWKIEFAHGGHLAAHFLEFWTSFGQQHDVFFEGGATFREVGDALIELPGTWRGVLITVKQW